MPKLLSSTQAQTVAKVLQVSPGAFFIEFEGGLRVSGLAGKLIVKKDVLAELYGSPDEFINAYTFLL